MIERGDVEKARKITDADLLREVNRLARQVHLRRGPLLRRTNQSASLASSGGEGRGEEATRN
jgi:hypothetical protein